MLLGEYEHTIDDKNRLTLPAKFRQAFERRHRRHARPRRLSLRLDAGRLGGLPRLDPRHAPSAEQGRPPDAAPLLLRRERDGARQAGPRRASRPRCSRTRSSAATSSSPGSTTTSRSGTAPPGSASSPRSKGVLRMLPNVLQPREADHVPVLAEEVRESASACSRARPSSTRPSAPAATPRSSPHDLRGKGKLIAIDRDPTARTYFEQLEKRTDGERTPPARRLRRRPAAARGERRPRRRDPARPRRLLDAARPARARLLVRRRRAARHAHGSDRRTSSARDVVNDWSERDLVTIFRRYGEERYAKQIARAIVRRRREQPFERTGELVDTIKAAIPAPARFGEGHPAKRVFQALRIAVNDELDSLETALPAALEMLRPGGRLAVISFHSLEDRIVKRFLRERSAAARARPTSPSASAATSRSSGRCSGGRSGPATQSSRRTRARRRRACAPRSRPGRRRPDGGRRLVRARGGRRARTGAAASTAPAAAASGGGRTLAAQAHATPRPRPHRLDDSSSRSFSSASSRVNVAVLRAHVAVSQARPASARELEAREPGARLGALGGRLGAAHRGGRAPARPRPGVGGQHVATST